jgi:putative nucleotidyltransferase with HDIG domain
LSSGITYRVIQFLRAVRDSATSEELHHTKTVLPLALFEIFCQMLPFEQAHAIRVYQHLCEEGYTDPDLLAAALLHDAGKARAPLRPWERALYVIGGELFPEKAEKWGEREPKGLVRGFVVAHQHAEWGAEMAEKAGASSRTVRLIARHQDEDFSDLPPDEQALLTALQKVDNVN